VISQLCNSISIRLSMASPQVDYEFVRPASYALTFTDCSEMATEISPPSCKVVLAQNIAKGLLAEVQERLHGLQKKPFLVGFMANEDPAAQTYADWSRKTAKEK